MGERLVIEATTADQLLRNLSVDNPPPEEKWFQRDGFDPAYGAKELRQAAKKGWIELDIGPDPALWRFRLTPAGRHFLAITPEPS